MAGIFHRGLRLRTTFRYLSPHYSLSSPATSRLQPADLWVSPISGQCGTYSRKLHSGVGSSNSSSSSSSAAPERLPFSRVTEEDLAFFKKILPGRTITDPDLLESSNVDWIKTVRGEDGMGILGNAFGDTFHSTLLIVISDSFFIFLLQAPVKFCWGLRQQMKYLRFSGKEVMGDWIETHTYLSGA